MTEKPTWPGLEAFVADVARVKAGDATWTINNEPFIVPADLSAYIRRKLAPKSDVCTFCGKGRDEAGRLIFAEQPGVAICGHCAGAAAALCA